MERDQRVVNTTNVNVAKEHKNQQIDNSRKNRFAKLGVIDYSTDMHNRTVKGKHVLSNCRRYVIIQQDTNINFK